MTLLRPKNPNPTNVVEQVSNYKVDGGTGKSAAIYGMLLLKSTAEAKEAMMMHARLPITIITDPQNHPVVVKSECWEEEL